MGTEEETSELQDLIIKLFPPHDYGEDSDVEELYNRVTDMEKSNKELLAFAERVNNIRREQGYSLYLEWTKELTQLLEKAINNAKGRYD